MMVVLCFIFLQSFWIEELLRKLVVVEVQF